MTSNPSKPLPIKTKIVGPFLDWWSLQNLNSAAELLLKLLSIMALILAADFFLLKPKIEWNVAYLDRIDRNKIQQIYRSADKEVPHGLTDAIDNFFYSLDYHRQTGVIFQDDFLIDIGSVPDDQFVVHLSDYLDKDMLSFEEEYFAWSALTEATVTVGKVYVSNVGSAPATKIQVIPPPPFRLVDPETQPLDLAPGQSVTIIVDAGKKYDFSIEHLWGDIPGGPPKMVVVWDTAFGVVNQQLFLKLSIICIFVWLTAILREIWFLKQHQTPHKMHRVHSADH